MKRVFGPANVAYEYAYHADKYSMDTQTTREIGQEWVQAGKWVQDVFTHRAAALHGDKEPTP